MGEPKISTFIVGLVIVSAIATIFAGLMSNIATDYGVTYSENENLSLISKMEELHNLSEATHKEADSSADSTSWLGKLADIGGAIVSNGITAARMSLGSWDIFSSMLTAGINQMGLGVTADTIKTAIVTCVLVIIFIGILISALIKREM